MAEVIGVRFKNVGKVYYFAPDGVQMLSLIHICSECKKEKQVRRQYETLKEMLTALRREGISYGVVHAAGTLPALLYPWLRLDAVRCGSALMGRLSGVKDRWGRCV